MLSKNSSLIYALTVIDSESWSHIKKLLTKRPGLCIMGTVVESKMYASVLELADRHV